jgi:hypothetical protein
MVKQTRSSNAGQALVEFAICMVTFLFILLGILQLVLFLNAQTAVRYAAFSAARSAIVTGGDREKMLDAARVALLPIFPRHGHTVTPLFVMESYLGAKQVDSDPRWGRNPLNIYDNPITKVSLIYPTTGLTFDDNNHLQQAAITVRVEHQYELVIPIVNAILSAAMKIRQSGGAIETPDELLKKAAKTNYGSEFSGYRIPINAYYTMNLENDLGDR